MLNINESVEEYLNQAKTTAGEIGKAGKFAIEHPNAAVGQVKGHLIGGEYGRRLGFGEIGQKNAATLGQGVGNLVGHAQDHPILAAGGAFLAHQYLSHRNRR